MDRRLLLPVVLIAALTLSGCGGDSKTVNRDPRFIYGDDGRALILRGFNVMSSSKGDPLRMPALTAAEVQRMPRDWGMNFVRFLIFWDALEPRKGFIDQAYLDRVEQRVNWFRDAGMWVMLDMHQDVYAQRFCCDGAPEWAIRDDGEPFELHPQWFLNYFQPAVMRSFDNFFHYEAPNQDLQDEYAEAWKAVARRFKDHPAVIGYDLMNEPSPGSQVDSLELFGTYNPASTHYQFDEQYFTPFYQRLINRLREVDEDSWLFFEPRYGAPGNGLPSRIGQLDDPRGGQARLVYAPHMYSFFVEASASYAPERDQSIAKWETERTSEAAAQGCPVLLGEWGLNRDTTNVEGFIGDMMATLDRMMIGWAYWSYDKGGWNFLNTDDTEHAPMADLIIRPVPKAIAGTPIQYSFDPTTREFTLRWKADTAATGTTDVYIAARRHYPAGWTFAVEPPAAGSSYSADDETLSITTAQGDGEFTLRVTPR